jgi:hypothetical protein
MWIVVRDRDGRGVSPVASLPESRVLLASNVPYVHQSLASARAEAKRLAKVYAGYTFYVMRGLPKSEYMEPKPRVVVKSEESKYAKVFD